VWYLTGGVAALWSLGTLCGFGELTLGLSVAGILYCLVGLVWVLCAAQTARKGRSPIVPVACHGTFVLVALDLLKEVWLDNLSIGLGLELGCVVALVGFILWASAGPDQGWGTT
jgi:hypothetical protein